MLAPVEIMTERLLLRRYRGADATALRGSLERSRDDLARFIPMPEHVPAEDDLAAELDGIDRAERPIYAVVTRADGAFVGTVALEDGDEPDVLAVAYWLDVAARGRGYATEAVGALVQMAFDDLEALRVEIWCAGDNPRSAAVARRLGFAPAGAGRPRPGDPVLERWARTDRARTGARAQALWVPLARHAAAMFAPARAGDGRLVLPCAGVEVTVTMGAACGRPYLILTAPVCACAAIDPKRALEHNGTLAVGALVVDEDDYILRHAMPLDGTPPWRLVQCVELVAQEAARLAAPCRTCDATTTFDLYAE